MNMVILDWTLIFFLVLIVIQFNTCSVFPRHKSLLKDLSVWESVSFLPGYFWQVAASLLYHFGTCKTKNPLGFVRYEVTSACFLLIVPQIGDIPSIICAKLSTQVIPGPGNPPRLCLLLVCFNA